MIRPAAFESSLCACTGIDPGAIFPWRVLLVRSVMQSKFGEAQVTS